MSDENATETAPAETTAEAGTSGFTAPTTQAEFDAMVKDRLKREQAKYADYTELKTKASEFDKLADAQKTETQRAVERAELAEKALLVKESEALRLSVIAKHSIPSEYQDFVSGNSEDELEAKAQKVLSLIPTNPNGSVRADHSQGVKGTVGPQSPAQELADIITRARAR